MIEPQSDGLAILHTREPGEWEANLLAFARFLGIEARHVHCPASGDGASELRKLGSGAVAMSADCLAEMEDAGFLSQLLERSGGGKSQGWLIYGYRETARHSALAQRWSGGLVRGVASMHGADRCSFPRASAPDARQLAGCDFERTSKAADVCFDVEARAGGETIMELSGRAAFVRSTCFGVPWFHWAGEEAMISPDEQILEDTLPRFCGRFVPAIIFLRAVFPGACWENPGKTARFVIDDPLLQQKYGFLNYDELFQSLTRLRCGVTTAFIPWNFRRTTPEAARAFAGYFPGHSLCVHGCDHTNHEFGGSDENLLTQKSLAALARMGSHGARTGLAWEPVMVFPQDTFSSTAMRALRRAGFLAVVNSTRRASDERDARGPLREELLPATNRYSGVPIFARRDPKRLSTLALDLFLGKPAHIMAHHDWFAACPDGLERCVRFLREVEPALSWPTLAESLPRQHLRREGGDGKCHVRFFTPTFEFASADDRARSFVFTRAEPADGGVKTVSVDGKAMPFVRRDGFVEFACDLAPRAAVSITLTDAVPATTAAWTPGLKYRASVQMRRTLSELRDNHLVKYPALLKTAKQAVRHLKWSADSGGKTKCFE